MELIKVLNEKVTQGVQPDLTLLLDCPEEVGLGRAITRNKTQSQKGQDRFEREKLDFHKAVRKGYLELARKNHKRFAVIDATLREDEMEEKIFEHIEPFLNV